MNHFYKHSFITSKVGLTNSLKSLYLWNNQVSMDSIYPKCFIINRMCTYKKEMAIAS